VTRTSNTITAHIRLPAGQHHTLTLPIPPTAAQLRKTPAAVVTAIDELLDHHTHAQIAGILNDRGLTSGEGRPFHRLIIRNIRDEYGLRSREQRLRDAGMLTLAEWPAASACPPKPSRSGTTPGSSPGTPTTTKVSASTRRPGPTRQPGHKDANSANGAPTATPLPQTTSEPSEMSDPTATVSTTTTTQQPASTRPGAVCSPRFRPGRPRRNPHDPHALAGEDGIERTGELGVAVPDEEPELADPVREVHDQVAGLLGNPCSVWILGHPEDMHPPGRYLHDEEHIHSPEKDSVHGEEVARR